MAGPGKRVAFNRGDVVAVVSGDSNGLIGVVVSIDAPQRVVRVKVSDKEGQEVRE